MLPYHSLTGNHPRHTRRAATLALRNASDHRETRKHEEVDEAFSSDR